MLWTKREDKKRMGIKAGFVWIKRAGGQSKGKSWTVDGTSICCSLAVIDTLEFITMRFAYLFRYGLHVRFFTNT